MSSGKMNYEDLDPKILQAFPQGSKVISVARHGTTRWSLGLKVDVEIGYEKACFFLKIIEREEWTPMAQAEFDSQTALAAIIPDNVVVPLAWGIFENATKAFLVTRFRSLQARRLSPPDLVQVMKRLHQNSVSPTGKFGFHTTTYWGPPAMRNDWTSSWEEYYARQFRSDVAYMQTVHGEDVELQQLTDQLVEKVIARLLRPLQTDGRSIKPSLCHGDLWDGNVQYDAATSQLILFDSCAFYGHNEIDLQSMGDTRHILGMEFVQMYKSEVGASEPREDFYDRHELYGIRADLIVAAICPEEAHLIAKAKTTMKRLLKKFPDGYDGFIHWRAAQHRPDVDCVKSSFATS
ncbi:Fructosamine kinase-domain-containing protein [Xylariaceae sp. FL1019]|nr:Fructosamine kinase-domain-containing protein [Xylariaceae sp. FL1019]